MISSSKKITGSILILAGCFPILLTSILLVKKIQIRQEMRSELEKGHLDTVRLNVDEVKWMDKHEIWVNDMMFDIHTKTLENGVYTFTGLYDEKETELVELENKATGENKENEKWILAFKSFPVFFPEQVQSYSIINEIDYPLSLNPEIICRDHEVLTPPPQQDNS